MAAGRRGEDDSGGTGGTGGGTGGGGGALTGPGSPLRPHLLAPVLAKTATSSKLKIYSWSLDRLILDCRPCRKSRR